MNGIDIVIVVCSLGLLVWGLIRGLTRMVMTIIAMFVGLIFATRSYDIIGGWLMSLVGNRSLAMMIGFVIAFLVVMLIFTLMTNLIKKTLDSVHLGCLDHLLGGALGFVAGILLSSVIIITLALFSPRRESYLKDSYLAPHVIDFSSIMISLVPTDLREDFLKKYYDLRRHTEKEVIKGQDRRQKVPSRN